MPALKPHGDTQPVSHYIYHGLVNLRVSLTSQQNHLDLLTFPCYHFTKPKDSFVNGLNDSWYLRHELPNKQRGMGSIDPQSLLFSILNILQLSNLGERSIETIPKSPGLKTSSRETCSHWGEWEAILQESLGCPTFFSEVPQLINQALT
jgi:hypothetical protein